MTTILDKALYLNTTLTKFAGWLELVTANVADERFSTERGWIQLNPACRDYRVSTDECVTIHMAGGFVCEQFAWNYPSNVVTFVIRSTKSDRVMLTTTCTQRVVIPYLEWLYDSIVEAFDVPRTITATCNAPQSLTWDPIPAHVKPRYRRWIELWRDSGWTAEEIARSDGRSPRRVHNKLSELRREFGDDVVPTDDQRKLVTLGN